MHHRAAGSSHDNALAQTVIGLYKTKLIKPDTEKIRETFEPYFVGAYLETATDPNLVHDIAAKLDTAAIYTPEDVRLCAEAVLGGKHTRVDAAIAPAQREFFRRWTPAIADDDTAELDTLTIFRRDVASFVNVYAFVSQIVDYGSAELESLHIYLSLLQRRIQPDTSSTEIDLTDLELKAVKQLDRGAADIKLVDPHGLIGMTAAGSGEHRDPTMVAFQQVLDRLNDLFGDEDFTRSQKVSFLESLGRSLLDDALVQQARVNTPQQFADYFFSDNPGKARLVVEIAEWFYQLANEGGTGAEPR